MPVGEDLGLSCYSLSQTPRRSSPLQVQAQNSDPRCEFRDVLELIAVYRRSYKSVTNPIKLGRETRPHHTHSLSLSKAKRPGLRNRKKHYCRSHQRDIFQEIYHLAHPLHLVADSPEVMHNKCHRKKEDHESDDTNGRFISSDNAGASNQQQYATYNHSSFCCRDPLRSCISCHHLILEKMVAGVKQIIQTQHNPCEQENDFHRSSPSVIVDGLVDLTYVNISICLSKNKFSQRP